MEQLLTFIANNPILVGAFAVVLAALVATESARLTRRWKELETTEAILLINRRDPVILDVSNSTDFAKGHILNAEHMPPSRIESGNAQLLKKKSRPVLVYCKNGQVSPQMAKRLVQLGFEDVNVLRGGLAQWIGDQQPVSRGKQGRAKGGRKGGKDKQGKDKPAKGKSGKNKSTKHRSAQPEPGPDQQPDQASSPTQTGKATGGKGRARNASGARPNESTAGDDNGVEER